METQDDESLMI
jgi:hypothetical protein